MLHQPSGPNNPPPQRRKGTIKYNQIVPSSPEPPRPAGVTIVARRPRLPHTTSQNHCAQAGRNTIDIWLCTRARHRDGVPDAGRHPHREAMHKQHAQPWSSCCVPFGCPDVHKETRSNDTRQECSHSSANTLVPVHHLTRTHQTDDKSKERKKKGYISKGFCAKTDLCPLASPRVALVGVRLLRHPDNGNTR